MCQSTQIETIALAVPTVVIVGLNEPSLEAKYLFISTKTGALLGEFELFPIAVFYLERRHKWAGC